MMMTKIHARQPAWGEYQPRGRDRILRMITRLGLSRGAAKDLIYRLYRARRDQSPVDIACYGIKWRLHPWDNITEKKILCGSKPSDRRELEFLRNSLQEGGSFVDVGANAGYYSLMAVKFGARQVLALEPNPIMFSRLRFNIAINKFADRITALQLAAGPQNGEMELYLDPDDLGSSGLLANEAASRRVKVPVKPLQDILQEAKFGRIDALKIDVEGLEAEILLPYFQHSEASSWPKLLIMEHSHIDPGAFDLLAWVQRAGYRLIAQTGLNAVLRISA
jgi:FkbM family methyltransferase